MAQKMEIEVNIMASSAKANQVEYKTAGKYHDAGSWKKTLRDKAIVFDENTKEQHNIEGTYPSSVRLRPNHFYASSQKNAWKEIFD